MATNDSQHESQDVDENGEVIIAEAVFKHPSQRNFIIMTYCSIGLFCALFLPCALMIGCILGFRAPALKLYLTSTGLHYNRVSSTGCVSEKFIPLSDIYDITVYESSNSFREDIISKVIIRINSNKISEHISWSKRTLYNIDYKHFYIINATEFGAAIKQQMQGLSES